MSKPKTIKIDNVEYVQKDSIQNEVVEFTGEETIMSRLIGKNVIVRSHNEGVNVGTVVLADETGVEIKDARRLYYMKPKDSNLSWYEGVAVSGLSDDSKVSGTVARKIIVEKYSMTEMTDEAYESVMNKTPNES